MCPPNFPTPLTRSYLLCCNAPYCSSEAGLGEGINEGERSTPEKIHYVKEDDTGSKRAPGAILVIVSPSLCGGRTEAADVGEVARPAVLEQESKASKVDPDQDSVDCRIG